MNYTTLGNARMRAHSLTRLGNWLTNVGRMHEGLSALRDALATFETLGDPNGIAEVHERLAMANGMYGDGVIYQHHAEQAIQRYRAQGEQRRLAASLAVSCSYASSGFNETSYRVIETREAHQSRLIEAALLNRQIDWQDGQAFTAMITGIDRVGRGEFGEALAQLESARLLAEELGHRQYIAATHWASGFTFAPERARARHRRPRSRAAARAQHRLVVLDE